ncbi:MAG: zinc-dependent metalloprotease, partial [Saprospiraceae bacterium]|nr:zinc-dependent metalloprotease [Saprospiraceae bacterium]
TNYVTGLFNQVATLYANEQINVTVSDIVIWTSQSPYTSTTSSGMLSQFTAYRQGFNGDLAQLLSYQASGGIAYLDGLCRSNPDYSMSYAGISSTYQNVPTYSWSVMVCTHEFGHLMGSNHTHACAWNGNNTAIDGCYTTEGSCPNPGIPQGGGTIMSYCHLTSAGINLNLGFGPQPGNVIRSEVSNASCLTACSGGSDTCNDGIQNGNETGVDCGGSCVPCDTGGNEGTLVAGHYFESGWDNWTDGGSDCYRYYGSISPEGSYSIRLRDNSGAGSTMFSPSYDFTPYNALDIQFQFYAVNMLPGQSLKINYFNGNTWSTVYSLISGSHFNNNIDYTATLTLTGTLDNNAKIAFECDGSDNNNLVYVDAVVLTGYYGSSLIEDQVQLSINPLHKTRIVDDNTLKDVQVYPNPALEQVKINAEEKILEVHIYSMEGKLLKALSPNDASTTIQIDEFNSGVLLFEIKTEESQTIEKIIKL